MNAAISSPVEPAANRKPSGFYRADLWRWGGRLIRITPQPICEILGHILGSFYALANPKRRAVITKNLLPVFDGDRDAARRASGRLLQQFALKLVDLWRFEAGEPMTHRFKEWLGWETFHAAQARGRGVLFLTPHLGNWEIGAVRFAERGIKLVVLTQPEPGARFTEMRQASRARWGVETLVIGSDAFGAVEVVKRLQAGEVIAMLVDRPLKSNAVTVELFGRPFAASNAAAELARASGCALLGGYIVRQGRDYVGRIFREFDYDRAALGNREARRQLTQEILRAFEPLIRQYPDQWYHFVPLWPRP